MRLRLAWGLPPHHIVSQKNLGKETKSKHKVSPHYLNYLLNIYLEDMKAKV
jgi:hypothetical protein